MNAVTLKKLSLFVGKVCTIITTHINRQFTEQISREHFVIRVQDVTPDGVWGTHVYNDDMVSFFSMPHIVSVHMETELDPADPEHARLIREYEEKTGKKAAPDVGQTPAVKAKALPVIQESPVFDVAAEPASGDVFIDIGNLERLAEQTRRSYQAYDEFGRSAK